MKEISASEFKSEVLEKQTFVLAFYSTECPPCDALAPKFESLAKLYGNDVKFLKIYRQRTATCRATGGVQLPYPAFL
jgi:thiol-disulfide isomerase/thioredoxin